MPAIAPPPSPPSGGPRRFHLLWDTELDDLRPVLASIQRHRDDVLEHWYQLYLLHFADSRALGRIPYLVFSLFSVPLALTPIQILSIDMGTESLTALGIEKPDPRMMQRPPRSQNQRLFDWPLALRAYLFLGAIESAIAMTAFLFVLHGAGWQDGHALSMLNPLYMQATTAWFSAIVVLQIVNVFLCRSATRSIFSTGLLGNPLIWGGVTVEAAGRDDRLYAARQFDLRNCADRREDVAFHSPLRRSYAGGGRSAGIDRSRMVARVNRSLTALTCACSAHTAWAVLNTARTMLEKRTSRFELSQRGVTVDLPQDT